MKGIIREGIEIIKALPMLLYYALMKNFYFRLPRFGKSQTRLEDEKLLSRLSEIFSMEFMSMCIMVLLVLWWCWIRFTQVLLCRYCVDIELILLCWYYYLVFVFLFCWCYYIGIVTQVLFWCCVDIIMLVMFLYSRTPNSWKCIVMITELT